MGSNLAFVNVIRLLLAIVHSFYKHPVAGSATRIKVGRRQVYKETVHDYRDPSARCLQTIAKKAVRLAGVVDHSVVLMRHLRLSYTS